MRMSPGDRLGAYELLALLGAGGMGEVYRARDARLNRDVAIKVLPAQVSDDPDRLRRFEQEARAASALNHPNILTVYDVGTHEGTRYLVTELLEGQTLAGSIAGRPLPRRKALDYALQLAKGLAAAHAKGIIHRDLKPANVFVTGDGRIKILDFGIAKLLPAFDQPAHDAETVTAPLSTAPDVIIGTAGYMAPEQVRGVAADQRSDLFSFGAVFYEMLTGRTAFARQSAVETITAVLTHDPLESSGSEPPLPPDVGRILRHCLEKNAGERFQSAHDLAFHLESLPAVLESRAPARRLAPMKIALWSLGGFAAAGTIVFAVDGRGLQSVPVAGGSVRQLTVLDQDRGELEHLWPMPVPGGHAVAFTVHYGARDTQRVHAVTLDSGARTMLVEGNGARFLPSGHIVFQRLGSLWAARFDPARLALTSPPAAVIDNVGIGADWSPILAAAENGSLAYATGGQPYLPRTFVWVDRAGVEQPVEVPTRSWFWPQVSPDGKRIGFHDMNAVNMDVWLYDLERAALVRMTFDPRQDGYPLWTPDGKQIAFWSRQGGEAANLYVRSADLTGSDRRLTTSPNYQLPFSWADGGKLLVFQENSNEKGMDVGVVALDGATAPTMLIQTPSDEGYPAVSPDGRWIAYASNLSGRSEIYVQPFPGLGGRWQVSMQGGTSPLWHPNGTELFYRINRSVMGVPVAAGGATFKYGSPRRLFEGTYVADDSFGRNYALAPDGRFLMMKEDPPPPPQVVVIVNWAEELKRLPQGK